MSRERNRVWRCSGRAATGAGFPETMGQSVKNTTERAIVRSWLRHSAQARQDRLGASGPEVVQDVVVDDDGSHLASIIRPTTEPAVRASA